MKLKKISMGILVLFLPLFLASCAEEVVKPRIEGFAVYEKVDPPYVYKAITPEGVIIQISIKPNYPLNADNEFWANAVENYVPQKGYKLVKKGDSQKGKYFIFLVPGVKYDYFYLVHFYINENKITLTEAGGQYAFLKDYETRIIQFASNF